MRGEGEILLLFFSANRGKSGGKSYMKQKNERNMIGSGLYPNEIDRKGAGHTPRSMIAIIYQACV